MPNKAEKSKPVAQAAALESSPSTPKPNKKRKANNNLNNPRSSQKVEETRVGSATADVKNATSPAPSLSEHPCPKATNKDVDTASPPAQSLSNPRPSHNDAKPSTKNTGIGVKDAKPQAHSPSPDLLGPETNKPEEGTSISHEDDYVSIKIKLAEDSNTDGEFVSVQDLQSEELLELPRVGHLQAADGTLKTVILSIKRRGVEYRIVFSNPPKDQDRTIAHDCMGLYVQVDYFGVGDLLLPLCEPIFNEADNNPISANKFQRFLQSAVTYLRLIPTTPAIEPYLGFLAYLSFTEAVGRQKLPSPYCNNMIYEVEFKDEKEPLVFKMVDRYGSFVQEFMTLLQCERLKIQAPRIKGLLGVGTNCGGFVMTKIQAFFCLDDCHSKSINSTLDDRKRWYQQILDALQALHRVDYIWGDAKPANVLINEDGDACLIDFEGGNCPGWVDDELSDTPAGDLQALGRIRKFLKLDE